MRIDEIQELENFNSDIKVATNHLMSALKILDTYGQHRQEADSIYEILHRLGFEFPKATGIK